MGKRKGLKAQHILCINKFFENGFKQEQALISAGYSRATARTRPGLVFDREDVQKEIAKRQAKMAEKHELTQDWIIGRFMKIAMAGEILAPYKTVLSDGSLEWNFNGAPPEHLALINEFQTDVYLEGRGEDAVTVKKFKAKHPEAHQALIALGRHLGFFNDKLEVSGSMSLRDRILAGRDRVSEEKQESEEPTVH